jgi:hypothetical protein
VKNFTEIIAVCSEITAEYINKFCDQNAGSVGVVANDVYRHLRGLNLQNISLAPVNNFGKN